MPSDFQSIKAAASAIEGMLSDFSMTVMDCVLSFQEENGVAGNIIEFGVFRGRSAAVLAGHVRAGERLILVDVADQIAREPIAALCPGFEFVECSSEGFARTAAYRDVRKRCRFIHIDSSHGYRATFNELKLAEGLLQDRGIICLDDFTNLNYSQILAATYKYLFTTWTRLRMFLVTDEKAYLCRKKDFEFFGRFALDRVIDEMARRGLENQVIARTDADPEYRAIYLRQPLPGEVGRHYGYDLYRQHYSQP
jgi:hypothetical protein